MPDDCATKADLKAQSDRHHDALTRITEVLGGMQRDISATLDAVRGTIDKPGHGHRISALEAKGRVAWWTERGTKLVDVLIAGLVVGVLLLLLKVGFQGAIRDIIRDSASDVSMALDMARKAPKDPSCPGCAPTVADAR